MSSLTLSTHEHPTGLVITLAGEIDLTSRGTLEAATRTTPPDGLPLRLDMSGVTFMDSSGLNFLLTLRHRLTAAGSSLTLTGIREEPMRVLALTGADTILLATGDHPHVPAPRPASAPEGKTAPSRSGSAPGGISAGQSGSTHGQHAPVDGPTGDTEA